MSSQQRAFRALLPWRPLPYVQTPTTHLVGAGSTLHLNPASPWTLSAHATYRHRSNASAAAPSELSCPGLTYQNTHLTLSAEVVGRLLIESTTTPSRRWSDHKLKLYRSLHIFGQLIAGNQAFQDALAHNLLGEQGPASLEDNLMVALIVDVEHRTHQPSSRHSPPQTILKYFL